MTDTIELLATRRSVPANALAEPGPSEAELETILTLAARVPDHGKLAPWRFVVIAGEARAELGRRLAAALKASDPSVSDARLEAQATCFAQSALVIAVVSTAAPHVKIPVWEQELSAGAVCMNMIVAATALGYGAQWLTGWAAYEPRAKEILGLAEPERVAGFVHIGRPTDRLTDRPRPELDKITTRWSA